MAAAVRYVIGIDHDASSISKAQEIATSGTVDYKLNTFSANHQQLFQVPLNQISAVSSDTATVEFRCADPMCLPAELHAFDIVILNDVIDKVSSPNSVLGRLGGARGLTKKGGLVFVVSAFQWNENRTPKDLWLNNSKQNASCTAEAVKELKSRLNGDFDFLYSKDITMVWRESAADVQGKVLAVTAFVRK